MRITSLELKAENGNPKAGSSEGGLFQCLKGKAAFFPEALLWKQSKLPKKTAGSKLSGKARNVRY